VVLYVASKAIAPGATAFFYKSSGAETDKNDELKSKTGTLLFC
jgi:hypothetical protein